MPPDRKQQLAAARYTAASRQLVRNKVPTITQPPAPSNPEPAETPTGNEMERVVEQGPVPDMRAPVAAVQAPVQAMQQVAQPVMLPQPGMQMFPQPGMTGMPGMGFPMLPMAMHAGTLADMSRLVMNYVDTYRLSGQMFYLVEMGDTAERMQVYEFAAVSQLVDALRDRLGQPVSIMVFCGYQMQITKPPFRHLKTRFGNIPLFDPDNPEDVDDSGWLGEQAQDSSASLPEAIEPMIDTPLASPIVAPSGPPPAPPMPGQGQESEPFPVN